MSTNIKKIVLAYSGGLDTSTIIPWLIEHYNCEVYAFAADVGQGAEELAGIEQKARASGAKDCVVIDLKQSFVEEIILPTLKTGAIYEDGYLLGTALARPVIAKAMVDYALSINADALSHGCTGKGNDQVRFETVFAQFAPQLKVIAPWREWTLKSREDCLEYLQTRNIPCSASLTKIYSRDANLWHISHEGGELEDPAQAPSQGVWTWTNSIDQAPEQAEVVTLTFRAGKPCALNGEQHSPTDILSKLNDLGATHGIGRLDIVENRLVGMKSRGCYETPGGTILCKALLGLEQLVYDRDSLALRQRLGQEFSYYLYDGKWFAKAPQAILQACDYLAEKLSGTVTLILHKGNVTVSQRESENSLYAENFATFGADDVYQQYHAEGFIRLYSLPGRIQALKQSRSMS